MKKIHDYIAADSRYYAKMVVRDIIDRTDHLVDFPEIGRVVSELEENSIRESVDDVTTWRGFA